MARNFIRPEDTHCPHNHEFTPENTYVYPEESTNAGKRVCKVCRMNAQRKAKGLAPLDRDSVRTWNRNKTHCPAGHEYTDGNTYNKSDGARACRICRRDHRIKKAYGLTPAQFQAMWDHQVGKCAICQTLFTEPLVKGEKAPHVDHDHTTGAVRSLLCTKCNTGLGRFEDDPARLQSAIDYLQGHQPRTLGPEGLNKE